MEVKRCVMQDDNGFDRADKLWATTIANKRGAVFTVFIRSVHEPSDEAVVYWILSNTVGMAARQGLSRLYELFPNSRAEIIADYWSDLDQAEFLYKFFGKDEIIKLARSANYV